MIGKLTGKIEIIGNDTLIIDVSGVGYLVYVSINTIAKLQSGITASLLIETHVREDLIQLFGFLNQEEKDCFLKLNLVSGVGTKVALSILSALSPSDVATAIAMKDKEAFRSISGIGPKLAERILLELKDKSFASSNINLEGGKSDVITDSVSALVNLGVSRNDAYQVVQKILRETPDIDINELIRLALKNRNG
jgi:Holliday junction DNA helicase RuvA